MLDAVTCSRNKRPREESDEDEEAKTSMRNERAVAVQVRQRERLKKNAEALEEARAERTRALEIEGRSADDANDHPQVRGDAFSRWAAWKWGYGSPRHRLFRRARRRRVEVVRERDRRAPQPLARG